MDISAQGQAFLTNFDVLAEAGQSLSCQSQLWPCTSYDCFFCMFDGHVSVSCAWCASLPFARPETEVSMCPRKLLLTDS